MTVYLVISYQKYRIYTHTYNPGQLYAHIMQDALSVSWRKHTKALESKENIQRGQQLEYTQVSQCQW